jgi:O-antigen ligase
MMRIAFNLSLLIAVLSAVASIAGLAVHGIYRETAWVIPQNRGQDLVTLVALLFFIPCAFAAWRNSPRGTLIWLGLLGYLAYTNTGAAFAYGFNLLFLVHVALYLSMCLI